MRTVFGVVGMIAVGLGPAMAAEAPATFRGDQGVELDAPYVPTPQEVGDKMLSMAGVGPDDIVYDLGSGDGRLVISAARDFKAKKGVGVDLDPVRVAEARANARTAGVDGRVTFHEGDLFAFDFSEASVLTLYLLPEMILKLRPTIQASLKPGSRIVAHDFHMGEWEADAYERIGRATVYYWVVPANVAGVWRWRTGGETFTLDLRQEFQKVFGSLRAGDDAGAGGAQLEFTGLSGDALTFEARLPGPAGTRAMAFEGKVEGDTITGTAVLAGRTSQVTATRVK